MTDRINALTVVLRRDIREDDLRPLVEAIGQFRDVLSVEPHVADLESHIAYDRARADLRQQLWNALEDPHA
jgi:hypothetical protein